MSNGYPLLMSHFYDFPFPFLPEGLKIMHSWSFLLFSIVISIKPRPFEFLAAWNSAVLAPQMNNGGTLLLQVGTQMVQALLFTPLEI